MIIKTNIIPKVAFAIGNRQIHWYAILIVIGIILGLIICKRKSERFNIEFDSVLELCLFMLPISIIGARAYYIIFSLDYYLENPMNIININKGGLAIYGGIIAGAITVIIYCKIRKLKILDLLDLIVPSLALGQSIGRWGNYINIEAYGKETTGFLKMEIIENGITKYVHPTFLYESIITFTIFILLTILSKRRKYAGEITFLYIITYSFSRIFIEYLRIDSLMVFNLKISLILSLLLFIIFSIILVYLEIKNNKTKNFVE